MSNLKLLYKILRLKGMKITQFWFKNRNKELHLAVKPYKNGCRCPECERRCRIVRHTTELRRWEDLTLMGMKVLLWYAPKEICCPTHGRVQETIPWAPAYSRITYRLEWRICSLCQIMTQKAAAEILVMPSSTLSDLLHRIITRVRHGHKIRGLVTLGVDEISFLKGRKFATLIIDRFHVVKALNQAVDEVRKDEWRALDTGERKAIKGLRWLLSMHSSHRTKRQSRFLNSLRNSNRRIHRAWVLKDEFEHIWNYRYRGSAEKFLKRWMTTALRSRIPSLRQFVSTVRNHFDNIVAFTDRNLTNAVGEGLNRIVKIVKNRASGYRNLHNFADMIYLTVGDLDIPAHIPSDLRTL